MSAGVAAPAGVAVPRHRQPLCGVSFIICQGDHLVEYLIVILVHSNGIGQSSANL
jgi:hypothetical protein